MVGEAAQVGCPVALFPEAEAFHLRAGVAHGCEAVWCTLQIVLHEFIHICADDLVRVDEDDFVKVERKEHIEEEDFIAPNLTLLFFLSAQPVRPFVGYERVLEIVVSSEVWEGNCSMNQNLTVCFVWRRTESIIMFSMRSYRWPEATEKMLMSARGSSEDVMVVRDGLMPTEERTEEAYLVAFER